MLYFIVMETPPSFFGRSSMFAVFQVMVIVFRLLLQGENNKHHKKKIILWKASKDENTFNTQTFTGELDSIERMLRQIELSLIAGDHESYKTSVSSKIHIEALVAGLERES